MKKHGKPEQRRQLTDRWINANTFRSVAEEHLRRAVPDNGQIEIFDEEVVGLGLRLSRTGRKTFFLRARFPRKKYPERRTIGDHPLPIVKPYKTSIDMARAKARLWREKIRNDVDPRDEETERKRAADRKNENTFRAVAEEYLRSVVIGPDEKNPKLRSGLRVKRDMKQYFIEPWGARPIHEITSSDIRAAIKEKTETPYVATNLFGYIRACFNWAVAEERLEHSPCDRIQLKYTLGGHVKKARERALDDQEVGALWRATGALSTPQRGVPAGYPWAQIYQMLLLAGLRLNEVVKAKWDEFDTDKKLWTVPAARMKMKKDHVVPLTDAMLAILNSLPRFKGPHLFSANWGRSAVTNFTRSKLAIDAAMRKQMGDTKLTPWVNHDLRRTIRTGMAELGVPDKVAKLVLDHRERNVDERHYNKFEYINERRSALEKWGAHVLRLANPTTSKVVPLRAGA